jgi:hypothetical protein
MRDQQIHVRTSQEDRELFKKAARIVSDSTCEKEYISKTIRLAVRKFAGIDSEDPSFVNNKN